MEDYFDFLSMEEQKSIQLKALFSRHHFQNYRLSAFESYDLYAKSREFATPQSVITFVGAKGQVMALKPDITLSIIKNTGNTEEKKVFYDEDVYRHDFHNEEYLRIHQLGIEHIGHLTHNDEREILKLALESLNILGTNRLHLSHQALVDELLSWFAEEKRSAVIQALNQKSVHELESYLCVDKLSQQRWQLLKDLLFATTADFDKMYQLFQTSASQKALAKLQEY
ncbi:ATP phosphoribosyltransferase regulatory subunit, partial [uncultured Enterococcus sp.]